MSYAEQFLERALLAEECGRGDAMLAFLEAAADMERRFPGEAVQ